ncbi:hypothetical protein ACNOYE_36155 [Nannocystaceae bacterium ST9]
MARLAPTRVVLVSTLLLGCDPPAEVVIDTRVETPSVRSPVEIEIEEEEPAPPDLDDLRLQAEMVGERALHWWTAFGSGTSSVGTPGSGSDLVPLAPVLGPPTNRAQLEATLAAVRKGPIDEVGAAVRNLAAADPAVWPEIRELLLAEREHGKREYKHVLATIGGDVPNRYGTFDLHWKKAHGYQVKLSEDWFEDLLSLDTARISKGLQPVFRETLLTCALLQAAPKIAAADPSRVDEVVDTLLDVAYVHEGTFRDEVGRSIDAIGDPAIPWLMQHSVPPENAKEDSPEERRAAYAVFCLDRMDRLHPQRAIEAVADDRRLLAAVLRNFAITRDGEAAPHLLAWIDSDAPGVRRAAREAFEAYVTGPLPKLRRKSIRLFGGRTTEKVAELGYREQARLAIRALLAEQAPDLLEPECRLFLPGHVVDETCERQPERLFRAWVARLDERRTTRRDKLVSAALTRPDHEVGAAMLDTLLTEGGEPPDPSLIAPHYAEVARTLADRGERAKAAQLLRKSAMLIADLEPARARELTVDALALEAEVEGVDERGRAMLLHTASELDPDSPTIAASLERIEVERERADDPLRRRVTLGVIGLLLALALLAALGRRLGPWLLDEPART